LIDIFCGRLFLLGFYLLLFSTWFHLVNFLSILIIYIIIPIVMSITTNYQFKNAAAATVDIGTIFCDLTNDQTVAGAKYFSGTTTTNQINIKGSNVLNFGSDQTKEASAGKIGYGTFEAGKFGIVGAGTTGGGNRIIKMWDNVEMAGYAYATSPPADSNDTSLATTAWVRSKIPTTGGSMELYDSATCFIDFKNNAAHDYDARIMLTGGGDLNLSAVNALGLNAPNGTYTRTPGAGSNNTEIATTEWVTNRIPFVLLLTINGTGAVSITSLFNTPSKRILFFMGDDGYGNGFLGWLSKSNATNVNGTTSGLGVVTGGSYAENNFTARNVTTNSAGRLQIYSINGMV
jgi:hypothetical protein